MSRDQIEGIRQHLRRAWFPFFSRFGQLTPVQIEVIPKILNNSNVVVAAPTASGKTEAVVAPVAERFVVEKWQNLAILYVVPTKALAEDTFFRIKDPLNEMNIKVQIRHGDKKYLSSSLPNFLITTPESLDSLLCRKGGIFRHLRAVIIDEIHFLDNTYRGDQLRVLLERLRECASSPSISTHLLSATLVNPNEIAQRYISEFEIVSIKGIKPIEFHMVNSIEQVYSLARQKGWKKWLGFCNFRESVEEVANQLRELWYPYPIVAHHGNLSKKEREETERVLREVEVGGCIATSTLEIGIDIGNIDFVLFIEIPWSISSFLQRLGRANRRHESVQAVAIAKSELEEKHWQEMLRFALGKVVVESDYTVDRSVCVQQILSYSFQKVQGVAEADYMRILSPLCSEREVSLLLEHLALEHWVERRRERFFATTKLMDFGEGGRIHSNIPDSAVYFVIDISSGKKLGTISGLFDRVFCLSGKVWKVVATEGNCIFVKIFEGQGYAPDFQKHRTRGAFYWLLPETLR